jgi:hypothetical protein
LSHSTSPPLVIFGGLEEWLKWQSACLATVRPWIQAPVPSKKKNWLFLELGGSLKLFALAGLELWFSWFQPSKKLG